MWAEAPVFAASSDVDEGVTVNGVSRMGVSVAVGAGDGVDVLGMGAAVAVGDGVDVGTGVGVGVLGMGVAVAVGDGVGVSGTALARWEWGQPSRSARERRREAAWKSGGG